MTAVTAIDVQLRANWVDSAGYRYDVLLEGETVVCGSRDPEYDAARVLRAQGFRGKFRTIDFVTGRPRMVLDIERAAGLRTVERADGGPPLIEPYRPLSDDVRSLLRTPTMHQGRVLWGARAQATPDALKEAGGERVGARQQSDHGRARRRIREKV